MFVNNVNDEHLRALRHTASHILAQAVKSIFPSAKLAIGPAIGTGFYYDFDIGRRFSVDDLQIIATEMLSIIRKNLLRERIVWVFVV